MSQKSIITDTQEIREILTSSLEESLKTMLPELIREAMSKPYMTPGEIKSLTGWSDRTLQHLRDTRQLAFVQHGRKILYPTDRVLTFLEERRVRTQPREKHSTTNESGGKDA